MFTGLIQATGTVLTLKPTAGAMRLIIAAPSLAGQWKIGDSIAVNGVCLTAVDMEAVDESHPGRFAADLAAETLARTTLGQMQPGALVNLELPTPSGSPLGGHVVQGHVDATAKLVSLVPLHPNLDLTDWRLTLEIPRALAAHVIPQGSITVDGISLTIAALHDNPPAPPQIEIAIIPHTYRFTNLRTLLSGAQVNIETDVLSKYAQRAAVEVAEAVDTPWQPPSATQSAREEWLTAAYLLANGY